VEQFPYWALAILIALSLFCFQVWGELSAANAVTDAIIRWNPRFVLMIGIAGGFPQDDLDLGDVVVADQIVGYEYGKVTDHGFKPRDRVYPASSLLLDRIIIFGMMAGCNRLTSLYRKILPVPYQKYLSVLSHLVTKLSLQPRFGKNSRNGGPS
jgi:hypothetical protein